MDDIDNIKKKLNIDELDKEYRNKMYNKFVEKGGKTVEDKKNQNFKFNRDKQVLFKEIELKKKQILQNKYGQTKDSSGKIENDKQVKKIKRYFSVFLKGFFQRTFTLSGNFNKNFSYEMSQNLIDIISDLNSSINNLLNADHERKWKNFEIINNIEPNGYEILIRINDLSKKNRNLRIAGFFNLTKNIICPQIIDDLKTFFKELFILYPYWETIKEVILKSEQLYSDYSSTQPFIAKVNINKYIDKIYSFYFPRILTILNYNLGKKVSYNFQQMKEFINLLKEEDIGSITINLIKEKSQYIEKLKKEKEETIKKLQNNIEQKDLQKIPKYIQKGLKIIDEIIEKKPDYIKKEIKLKLLTKNEKALDIYCILYDFDVDYSFIMTTSQIVFNPKIESGKRIDMKAELESLYIRYNEINSHFKDYFDLTTQLVKFKDPSNKSLSFQNTNIQNIEKKKFASYVEIKNKSINFFKKFAIIMQTIIQDFNTEKKILENPEEKLHFQSQKGITQKLENMTVINSILLAFSFSSAIHYYLTSEKIMSKGLFFIEEEKKFPQDDKKIEEL